MRHEDHIALLVRCRPLAQKLLAQKYSYEYSLQDSDQLAAFEQSSEALNADDTVSDSDVEHIVAAAGLSPNAMLWLVALREIAPQVRATKTPSYQPFTERLRRLEQAIHFSFAMGILYYGEDSELFTLPTLARTNPLMLLQAERVWQGFNHSLFVEEEATPPTTEASLPRTHRRKNAAAHPSHVTFMPWLYAYRLGTPSPHGSTTQGGHWKFYVARDQVDTLWEALAQAVQKGQLGPKARVSTRSGSAHFQNQEHKICVYASNSFDTQEVMYLRAVLRDLGVTWVITYKLHGERPKDAPPPLLGHDTYTLYIE